MKKRYDEQVADYRKRRSQRRGRRRAGWSASARARRRESPDPATVLLIATGPRARLWERRTADPDFLTCASAPPTWPPRSPSRTRPARAPTRVRRWDRAPTCRSPSRCASAASSASPAARRLAARGRDAGRWPRSRRCTARATSDLRADRAATGPRAGTGCAGCRTPARSPARTRRDPIGTDAETLRPPGRRADRADRRARRQPSAPREPRAALAGPTSLVVLDGARRLRSLPGMVALLRDGPARRRLRRLPRRRRAAAARGVPAVRRARSRPGVRRCEQQRVTDASTTSAPTLCQPAGGRAAGPGAGADPRRLRRRRRGRGAARRSRLLDVLGPRAADAGRASQAAGGRAAAAPRPSSATRSTGRSRSTCGATGRTGWSPAPPAPASPSCCRRSSPRSPWPTGPTRMTFVLVDYKGGAAFKDCDRPAAHRRHGHRPRRPPRRARPGVARRRAAPPRAHARRRRRQGHRGLHRPAAPRPGAARRCPGCCIVIDEFASLVARAARLRHRPGQHRPARPLARRPPDPGDPAARPAWSRRRSAPTPTCASRCASPTPASPRRHRRARGRRASPRPHPAAPTCGSAQSSLVPFQSGRVGGRRPGAVGTDGCPRRGPWRSAGAAWAAPLPAPAAAPRRATDEEITDLAGAGRRGPRAPTTQLGVPAAAQPLAAGAARRRCCWTTCRLPAAAPSGGRRCRPSPYGVEDLPARAGPAPVASTSRPSATCTSSARRAAAGRRRCAPSPARWPAPTPPADVHLYGIDCGNGALLPLDALPHCGAVVSAPRPTAPTGCSPGSTAELARRQELLAARGYRRPRRAARGRRRGRAAAAPRAAARPVGGLPRQPRRARRAATLTDAGPDAAARGRERRHPPGHRRRPAAADRPDGLADRGQDRAAAARPQRLLPGRPAARARCPRTCPAGRASGPSRASSSSSRCSTRTPAARRRPRRCAGSPWRRPNAMPTCPARPRPFRVDVLPARITFEEAWELRPVDEPRPLWGLVGVGGDEIDAVGFDLARTPVAMIGGPARSGRSTTLLSVTESLLRGGAEVVIAAPRPSPLRDLAGRQGVRASPRPTPSSPRRSSSR